MQPPDTPREDTAYERHGLTIDDPYRWLEDSDADAVTEWVTEQNEYADSFLGGLSARDALRPRLEAVARTVEYEPIRPTESRFFQRIRHPDDDHAILYTRESPEDEPRELLDPNAWSEDGSISMNWYEPSPDGAYVAYGVDEGGQENYDLHVFDVDAGEDLEILEGVGRANLRQGAWTDDGFFVVTTGDAADGNQLDKELRYHELGTDPETDLVVETEFPEAVWPHVSTDRDTDHVVIAFATWDTSELYYVDQQSVEQAHSGDSEVALEPLLETTEAQYELALSADDLYLRTTHEAPAYRICRLDLGAGDRGVDDLETVVPEDATATIDSLAVTDERLFVGWTRDVVSEVTVHDREGNRVAAVDVPGKGTIEAMEPQAAADAVFVSFESFDHPRSASRIDREGDFEVIDRPDVEIRADLAVTQEWYESADGTEVPVFIVRRADVEPDATNPAVLYGYGGFGISLTPAFRSFSIPFLEDGGVLAVATLRGGAEFGEEWHHAARRETKQKTFDDFAAAAEHLVDRGWAAPDRLAAMGGSNGGLTVGATITQRPDLFTAAVSNVPLLDMLRFHRSLLGASWTGEYGDPENEDAFELLLEYSPYHNVEVRPYPDILFTTAKGDTRVDPFHARKMTARMQAQAQDTLVLLKTYDATGHGVGKPVSQAVAEQSDKWGFLYDRLDIDRVNEEN